jgi:hypothetical protein
MSKSTTKYSNNARTTLATGISPSDTNLSVATSVGFPSLSVSGDHFFITLDNGSGIEIVRVNGVSGNTLTGCLRGQDGTTAGIFSPGTVVENRLTAGNITSFARLQDRVSNVASLSNVLGPTLSDANSILCASLDATDAPILLVASGTKWRLVNYPDIVLSGTVGSLATSTTMQLTDASTILNDSTPRMYVIQFISGANIGSLRIITARTSSDLSWVTALPAALSAADSFEIYRCIVAWKAPLGGQTDRIFFENDNRVRFDYNIPVNRNASSTGPVTVALGATVNIPLGSAWSIL